MNIQTTNIRNEGRDFTRDPMILQKTRGYNE